MKKLLVQKFGGTSIGTAERLINVAEIVKSTLAEGNQVAIVLSAMSSKVKTEGTTSQLLAAAEAAIHGGTYYKFIDHLEERHLSTIQEAVKDRRIQGLVQEEVREDFHQLKSFLDAIAVIGEISPRSNDVIVSLGEKLAARIFTALLNSLGVDAEFVNLENIISKKFKEVSLEFCVYLQTEICGRLAECGSKVPVITGFFGFVEGGIIRSIGRGYTDFTAALIAAGCKATELQIWKEVDGIFSADPNKVKTAKVLPSISPEEALELTYYGSEVIHPFTMEQVTRELIPVRIKNTFDPSKPGTLIDPRPLTQKNRDHRPTAVTIKRGVTLINLYSNRMLMAYGFMTKVFTVLNRHEIVIDMIATSEVNISMTLAEHQEFQPALEELKTLGQVTVKKNMAILSLVGRGMRHKVGVSGRMFSRLAEAGINIEVISQGASEINISCAIRDIDADKALAVVHAMIEEE